MSMLADGGGWKESAVGSSRDSLGKGTAIGFKEEPRRTGGSNIGGADKTGSHILVFLPKSELKGLGVVIVGNCVTLIGSLIVGLGISIGATALAVLRGGAGTTAG